MMSLTTKKNKCFMVKESKFAIFNYKDIYGDLINDLVEYLEKEAKEIYDFFGIKESYNKPIINIVSTKKEFDEYFKEEYGYEAPKYSRGIFKRDGSINYLSIKDYSNTTHAFKEEDYDNAFVDFKKTLMHEYVHYVNSLFNQTSDCGPTAIYLREGIAVYLSRQKENESIKFDFSLDDILSNNTKKKIYNAYYLLVKYLVENYDKSFVLELFKSNRAAKEFLIKELFDGVVREAGEI